MKLSGFGLVDWLAAFDLLIFLAIFLPGAAGSCKLAGRGMRSRVVEALVVKKIGKEPGGDQVGEGVDVWGQGTVLGDFGGFGADGLLGLSG